MQDPNIWSDNSKVSKIGQEIKDKKERTRTSMKRILKAAKIYYDSCL